MAGPEATAADVLARLAASTGAAVEVRAGADVGSGTGAVTATADGAVVVLTEAGVWAPTGGRPMRWRAVSRWHAEGAALAVEHVRQGAPARAVLDCGPDGTWAARAVHVCGADGYAATVRLGPRSVEVAWTISGPRKAAHVVTRYV